MGTRTRSKSSPVVLENIVDTGTEGTKVAVGTAAQRGSTTGQWRYNTDSGFFEGRNTDGSFSTLEPTPTIISVDEDSIESAAGGNITIRISGTNFVTGGTISFVASDASVITAASSTFVNAATYDAVIARNLFVNAKEPYDVKYSSATGIIALLENSINVDNAPTWTTASGNLATIGDSETGTHATLVAADADGDTIAYTETGGTVLATNNLTLNSSTGAISGDPTDVAASTTHTFTGRATAGTKTADRSFNIIVTPTLDGSTSAKAAPSATHIRRLGITENNFYWISTTNGVTQKVPMILETGISGSTTATARGFIITANNSEPSGNYVNTNHQPRLTANTGQVGWNSNNGSLPTGGDWESVVDDQTNFSINMQDIGFDEIIFMAHGTGAGDTGNWETSFGSSPSNTFASTTVTKALSAVNFTQNIKIPTVTTWFINSSASVNFGSNSATSSPETYWDSTGYVPTGFPSRRLQYTSTPSYALQAVGVMNDSSGSAPTTAGLSPGSQTYPLWVIAYNSPGTTGQSYTFSWADTSGQASPYGWDDLQDNSGMGDSWAVEGQGNNAFRGHPALILVRA